MDSPPAAPSPPRDSSSPEPSFSAQIATLQAQLAALQALQPLAAAAPTPPASCFPNTLALTDPSLLPNWLRQLRLTLPNQLRSYVLDGVIPATWTAEQLPARDDLPARSSDQLSAPRIFATLKACFAPDDATRTLELFAHLWDFKKMPASVEAYDTWLREYMSVAQEIRDAKTLLNDVLATHVLAMDFPTSPSAMLATPSLCPACHAPGHRLRDCKLRAKHPPTGPCHQCHKKGHWALDCKHQGEQKDRQRQQPRRLGLNCISTA
ncbi:BQ5605_C065g12804 [Microbotryum silenes-dioicae]|uniref:BQ5605_C065g12804 protein n=1 Tax=Microbotryum silenes-dioicae TaxID=796604 RepID=A0A2X0ND12_9BASI|nr:BQ5605_C065g12804 [Microbotryum silenes-dioicae]